MADPSGWLVRYWVASALIMGIVLTLLSPVLWSSWSPAIFAVFVQLPVYMFHQVEEHTGDRFRTYVNQKMFGGLEALTPESVLWINIPGVWGLNIVMLYVAQFGGIAWSLGGVYLTLVNAVIHVIGGVAQRAYNPGLWTAIVLFFPVGGWALMVLSAEPGVTRIHHVTGLAIAILIHVAIIIYTNTRVRHLRTI